MPVGAFGGRRAIMEKIAPLGPVYQAGTLSGNPVAVAAGLATLARDRGARASTSGWPQRTRALTDGLAAAAQRAGVPFCRAGGRRHVRPLFRARDSRHLRRGDGVRQGALQPLLPRDARRRRLPRAVGVRSGLRVAPRTRPTTSRHTVALRATRRSPSASRRSCRSRSAATSPQVVTARSGRCRGDGRHRRAMSVAATATGSPRANARKALIRRGETGRTAVAVL